jgi:hypothetical protein
MIPKSLYIENLIEEYVTCYGVAQILIKAGKDQSID